MSINFWDNQDCFGHAIGSRVRFSNHLEILQILLIYLQVPVRLAAPRAKVATAMDICNPSQYDPRPHLVVRPTFSILAFSLKVMGLQLPPPPHIVVIFLHIHERSIIHDGTVTTTRIW